MAGDKVKRPSGLKRPKPSMASSLGWDTGAPIVLQTPLWDSCKYFESLKKCLCTPVCPWTAPISVPAALPEGGRKVKVDQWIIEQTDWFADGCS